VSKFGATEGLDVDAWVHDLPLWSLSKRETETGIVRRLQIGAYVLDQDYEVRIIPQVFRVDRDASELVAPNDIDPKLIKGLPPHAKRDELLLALKQAWADLDRMPAPGSRVVRIPISQHYLRSF
jgi:hypothetical protein